MKKLLYIILVLIPTFAIGQAPGRFPYKKIIQSYSGDTLTTQLSNDTARISTNQDVFNFNKPICINGIEIRNGSVDTVYLYTVSASATTTIIIGITSYDLIDISNYVIKLTSHYQSGNAKIMLKGSNLYINSGQTIDTNGGAGIGISITYNLSGSNIQMNIINSTAEAGTIKLTIKKI